MGYDHGRVEMKSSGKQFTAFLVILGLFLIQGATGIQITSTGGSNCESGSVNIKIEAANAAAVNSQLTINGADLSPTTSITGVTPIFKQTHAVTDSTGKNAEVYVEVDNAQNGLKYRSKVLPREGSVGARPWVSAEQWLTVPKADSITCTASASYKTALSADVGLDEQKGPNAGDYVTLTKYYAKAYASATKASSSQTATDGSADKIVITGHAKDSSGSYGVETTLNSVPGANANFKDLSTTSMAGTTTQVAQAEQVIGSFYSIATVPGDTKTRTSGFGVKYDLNMQAAKGSPPTGTVGYYVDLSMATPTLGAIQGAVDIAQSGDTINVASGIYLENVYIGKALTLKGFGNPTANSFSLDAALGTGSGGVTAPIVNVNHPTARIQDGVNLASSGGTVNVAAGTYVERVKIDKLLVVKGDGCGTTIVDGNKKGSVFTTGYKNPKADVTLSDMTIRGGSGKSITTKYGTVGVCGGGVLNYGKLTITGCTISGNTAGFLGGGIYNVGTLKVLDKSTISGNTAAWGGGLYNYGTTIVKDSDILENIASNSGGGIYACCSSKTTLIGSQILRNTAKGVGGGIAAQGTLTVQGASIISGNTANLGGGICWKNNRPVIDSTSIITGNSKPQVYPY